MVASQCNLLFKAVTNAKPDDFKPDVKPEPNAAGLLPGDEVIDSDLDDSEGDLDEDPDAEEDGEVDIVFCVYDKVGVSSNM